MCWRRRSENSKRKKRPLRKKTASCASRSSRKINRYSRCKRLIKRNSTNLSSSDSRSKSSKKKTRHYRKPKMMPKASWNLRKQKMNFWRPRTPPWRWKPTRPQSSFWKTWVQTKILVSCITLFNWLTRNICKWHLNCTWNNWASKVLKPRCKWWTVETKCQPSVKTET